MSPLLFLVDTRNIARKKVYYKILTQTSIQLKCQAFYDIRIIFLAIEEILKFQC